MEKSLKELLSHLYTLDSNGWATLTDGTLDDLSTSEKIAIVKDAIAYAIEMNQ